MKYTIEYNILKNLENAYHKFIVDSRRDYKETKDIIILMSENNYARLKDEFAYNFRSFKLYGDRNLKYMGCDIYSSKEVSDNEIIIK